jgi:ketosteroid isomerase-like protein
MTTASDTKAIDEIRERLRIKSKAYYNRDFVGIMDVYLKSEDICIYDPPIIYYGWDATAKMIRDFIDGSVGPMRIDYRSIEGRASGDLACSWQVAHIDTDLPSGQNVKVPCRMTDVWRRVDGTWYVIHEHNSIPQDLNAANAMFGLTSETMSGIARD